MSGLRRGRRKYYNLFSSFYDDFVRLHARKDEDDTRHFLVGAARLERRTNKSILDICCGTGSVILAFAERHHDAVLVGYDFSRGMLRKAREKDIAGRALFVEGDAAELPFSSESFDRVTCSHALYELKGQTRQRAFWEMRRVLHPEGEVLLMEHEVPRRPVVRLLFYLRLFSMGFRDAREFLLSDGAERLKRIFSRVEVSHSPSGKSRLMICRK
ncbi:MAG: methyltransferase domain-containing protein [Deltaproteobacteria bacterium]